MYDEALLEDRQTDSGTKRDCWLVLYFALRCRAGRQTGNWDSGGMGWE